MTVDVDAIADAIAGRYAPGVLAPPAGLTAIRASTADLPNRLSARLPTVLVFAESGALEVGGGTRIGEHLFLVRFYYARLKDAARELNAARRWATVLLDAHAVAITLGGLVVAVRTIGWRVAVLDYAGVAYTGVENRLQAVTSEAWSPTA